MMKPLALPDLPISHPVHVFAVMSLIVLVVPIIPSKLRLPGTARLIMAVVVSGPSGLNIRPGMPT